MVSSIYGTAVLVYGLQGNYDLALKCNELSEQYSCDEEDSGFRFMGLLTSMISAGCYREALDVMIIPALEELSDDSNNSV